MDCIQVTAATSGYDGWLGICVGHRSFLNTAVLKTETEKKVEDNLLQWMQKVPSHMTAGEMLAVLKKTLPQTTTSPPAQTGSPSSISVSESESAAGTASVQDQDQEDSEEDTVS